MDTRSLGNTLGPGHMRALGAAIAMLAAAPALQARLASAATPRAPQVAIPCPPDLPGGAYCGDGGPVEAAKLSAPRDVAAVPGGFLVADGLNSVIRRVKDGKISTVAGIGIPGDAPPRKRASVATVALADPRGVAALPGGAYAIADAGLRAVLLVGADGIVRTLRDSRTLLRPVDVVARDADTLVVADVQAGRVFELDLDGTARTIATGLANPWQVATDPVSGGIYVSQQREGAGGDVILVKPDGSRSIVAGPGAPGVAGKVRFERVAGVVAQGPAVVVADRGVVRAFFADGTARLLAGVREGDANPVGGIDLAEAEGIALTQAGRLLVADSGRDVVHTVPDVPPSSDVPKAKAMAEPQLRTSGASSEPPPRSVRAVRRQAPGAKPCRDNPALAPDIAPLQVVRNGTAVRVKFPIKSDLSVLFVPARGGREVQHLKAKLPAKRGRTIDVSTRRKHGPYLVRVRAQGACRQRKFPL